MYLHSAALYDLMHQSLDYESAANRVRQLIADRYPGARSLLDVACGTGRHLELLEVDLVAQPSFTRRTCGPSTSGDSSTS